MLMWYRLPPDSDLTLIFQTYHGLLETGRAPYPVPVYIDERLVETGVSWSPGNRFDLAYYLMFLHATEERDFSILKTMFSAFASTHDPLDHHMIWHQRAVLEAVGTFTSDDLHVLDMGYVSQLLSLGQCHWAIYVVLHMPHRDDYPYLQATVIREILFQYCETWSAQENQQEFIEGLGIPSAWLHEALISLEEKNDDCRDFFNCLKESLAFWDTRLPIDARMVYANMAKEISDLLVADSGEGSTTKVKLDCFNTIFDSPIPEDLLSCHLQSAVSHFTLYLTEAAS